MKREYFSDSISNFLNMTVEEVFQQLALNNEFTLEQTQKQAWLEQIKILHKELLNQKGAIYFEYSIPRMGRRIDTLLLIGPIIFILEFKVGEKTFTSNAYDQVWDYALDLKNFHETSHNHYIAPMLIATNAKPPLLNVALNKQNDKVLFPITCNSENISQAINSVQDFIEGNSIDNSQWETGRYCPTPTIIEAATSLFNNHSVEDITRTDANAINLKETSNIVSKIIKDAKQNNKKSICFVTGVPGAGKTLVGLNTATKQSDKSEKCHSVFLSGNGPLVKILREALIRDKVAREKERGNRLTKKQVSSHVEAFIQNVHHFRDECLIDTERPPIEHVVLFDEAQRAWNKQQTTNFMARKKKLPNFNQSEPEFLISCLDRHNDWAVIVCLVGGGQEINTGEAGILEWVKATTNSYSDWNIYLSPQLTDSEYGDGKIFDLLKSKQQVTYFNELHLSVSMRSYRAENVSSLVKHILDINFNQAKQTLNKINKYPIVLTRQLSKAKQWLQDQARGTERYGIIVSSQAERLKPHAIDVKAPVNPVHWFLNNKDDVRSSYYLEDVATEFHVQGLELDWACITWDADLRHSNNGWIHKSFRGNRWININQPERKNYQKNAYRVLLTRARQGMVIVIPEGDQNDPTRLPEFYDSTFNYLKSIGFETL